MVATRKTPVAPAPASRTTSTQPLPRPAKAKSSQLSSGASNDVSAGKDTSPTSLQKSKQKKSKRQTAKSQSLLSRIFSVLLVTFTVHAFYKCPTDYTLSSPVCHSLSLYNTHVLQPYVLPPIRATLTHNAVAPHVANIQRTAAPFIHRAVQIDRFVRPYAVRAVTKAASNFWKAVLHPLYRHHVIPRYNAHLRPHILVLQFKVQPYMHHVYMRYTSTVHPILQRVYLYTNEGAVYLYHAYTGIKPYVFSAWAHTKPHIVHAYAALKPHVLNLWAQLRPHLCAVWKTTKAQAAATAVKLGVARREFVDPHVVRIWDKVVELSGGERSSITRSASPILKNEATAQATMASTASVLEDKTTFLARTTPSVTESLTPEPTPSTTKQDYPSAPEPEAEPEPEAQHQEETAPETPEPEQSVSSVVGGASAATVTDTEPMESASSIAAASAGDGVGGKKALESLVDEIHASEDAAPPKPTLQAQEEELDDFLRDIGLEDDAPKPEPTPDATATPETQGSAEEEDPSIALARQREATIAKRADIVGRHQRWQAALDELSASRERRVRETLVATRGDAVRELGGMEGAVRGEAGVEGEAGRLVRGLEGFLRKESAGNGNGESKGEKLGKWGKVVGKVEERFGEKVRGVQGEVHKWYMGVREKEVQEILQASSEVKSLAEKAQADIGLDYAWLDDVTYDDWQKYHDLMRTAERFADQIRAVQNGTHATPFSDPLVSALNELEQDLNDVIAGFQARVRALGAEAEIAFLVVAEPLVSMPPAEKPDVSMLPIAPEAPEAPMDTPDLEGVFVGRGKEEVIAAIERAGVEVEHEEL